jgi:hypothetical protein
MIIMYLVNKIDLNKMLGLLLVKLNYNEIKKYYFLILHSIIKFSMVNRLNCSIVVRRLLHLTFNKINKYPL